jgi:hypothetical protein
MACTVTIRSRAKIIVLPAVAMSKPLVMKAFCNGGGNAFSHAFLITPDRFDRFDKGSNATAAHLHVAPVRLRKWCRWFQSRTGFCHVGQMSNGLVVCFRR